MATVAEGVQEVFKGNALPKVQADPGLKGKAEAWFHQPEVQAKLRELYPEGVPAPGKIALDDFLTRVKKQEEGGGGAVHPNSWADFWGGVSTGLVIAIILL